MITVFITAIQRKHLDRWEMEIVPRRGEFIRVNEETYLITQLLWEDPTTVTLRCVSFNDPQYDMERSFLWS